MKSLVLSLFVLLTLSWSLSSCSKDDDDRIDPTLDKALIVGVWDVVKVTVISGSDAPANIVLTINQNNTYQMSVNGEVRSGTYVLSGNVMKGTTSDEDGSWTETFEFTSIKGNYAYVNYSNSHKDVYKVEVKKQ